jgi:hypothetical protein
MFKSVKEIDDSMRRSDELNTGGIVYNPQLNDVMEEIDLRRSCGMMEYTNMANKSYRKNNVIDDGVECECELKCVMF